MNWAVIIAVLLELFGPALAELAEEIRLRIQAWIDGLFARAKYTAHANPSESELVKAQVLWGAVLDEHDADGRQLWFWQLFAQAKHARRTRLLEKLRASSLNAVANGRPMLLASEAEEIRGLAMAAV
jgi:hypothetical protein